MDFRGRPGTASESLSVFHHSCSTLCQSRLNAHWSASSYSASYWSVGWWHLNKMLLSSRSRETISCFIRLRHHVTLHWPAWPVLCACGAFRNVVNWAENLTHIWNILKLTFKISEMCHVYSIKHKRTDINIQPVYFLADEDTSSARVYIWQFWELCINSE